MKRFLSQVLGGALVMAVAMVLAWTYVVEPEYMQLTRRLNATERALTATHAQLLQDRPIDLPEDGNNWHTILFLSPNWKTDRTERRIHSLFYSERGLVSIREQTHWHVITSDQAEFQKFRPLVDVVPCLLIERANGEVIYRESGPQLAHQNDGLVRAIRKEVQRHCPDGRCLPLHPTPGPSEPEPKDEIPSVLTNEPPPVEKAKSPLLAVLGGLGGLAGGVAGNWKKRG